MTITLDAESRAKRQMQRLHTGAAVALFLAATVDTVGWCTQDYQIQWDQAGHPAWWSLAEGAMMLIALVAAAALSFGSFESEWAIAATSRIAFNCGVAATALLYTGSAWSYLGLYASPDYASYTYTLGPLHGWVVVAAFYLTAAMLTVIGSALLFRARQMVFEATRPELRCPTAQS